MRFVLIDKIVALEPGKLARAFRDIPADDDYFLDHFPGYPVVPGVLLLESMAQLGGRLIQVSVREASHREVLPMLAMVERAQFRRPVRPGERLDLAAEVTSLGKDRARVSASASVSGQAAASALIMYGLAGVDTGSTAIPHDAVAGIRAWDEEVWRRLTGSTGPR